MVVSCSAEEIVKFPTQPEKIGEDCGHLEEFQDVLTGDEVDIMGPLITVEDEPFMMLGSDPNTIKLWDLNYLRDSALVMACSLCRMKVVGQSCC
ncbi:hypothetical protein Tco_0082670 [Tanacetum coccineum]